MTPSSAQRLGQSTIRSLRANVVGIRAPSQGTLPVGIGGFRGICPPFSNELPCRYHGAARHGTVLVVGHHARSMKKSPRLDVLDSHYVAGDSSRLKDTYRRHRVILWTVTYLFVSRSA
jgi:hypothetical protein